MPRGVALVVHPSAELYGSDRMLVESVLGLRCDGWRPLVVLPTDGPLVHLLDSHGIEVVQLGFPVLRKALMSPSGLLALARDAGRAAMPAWRLLGSSGARVVYVNTVTVPIWLALARLRGIPSVCHVHEAEESLPGLVRWALSAPLHLTRVVLANSEASRGAVTAGSARLERRTQVVHNGIEPPATAQAPRDELAGPVRLVLVGRISPRKGTDVAVEAVRELVDEGRDVTLDVVGGVFPGYEWFVDEVRGAARSADLCDRVRWRGVVEDPWPSLAEADIALVPSRVEPFGNTAVEAMLAARPLVASATQGLAEVVRPGRDGEVVAPGDAQALADAVGRVIDDWPAARARALAAAVDAAERFSPERYRRDVAAAVARASRRHRRSSAMPFRRPGRASTILGRVRAGGPA
jgi:glycosyltransferase involved in cell wall biosynthesis